MSSIEIELGKINKQLERVNIKLNILLQEKKKETWLKSDDITLLNSKQLSKKLGVSQTTISRWVKARAIPYHLLNGIVRFDERIIDSWIIKRQVRLKPIL